MKFRGRRSFDCWVGQVAGGWLLSRVAVTSLREPTMINCRVALTQGFAGVQKLTDIMDGPQGANDKRIRSGSVRRVSLLELLVSAIWERLSCPVLSGWVSEWVSDRVSKHVETPTTRSRWWWVDLLVAATTTWATNIWFIQGQPSISSLFLSLYWLQEGLIIFYVLFYAHRYLQKWHFIQILYFTHCNCKKTVYWYVRNVANSI